MPPHCFRICELERRLYKCIRALFSEALDFLAGFSVSSVGSPTKKDGRILPSSSDPTPSIGSIRQQYVAPTARIYSFENLPENVDHEMLGGMRRPTNQSASDTKSDSGVVTSSAEVGRLGVLDADCERGLDLWLLGAVLALLGLGTVMVYSSSAVFATSRYHDGLFFLRRHLMYAGIGLGVLYLVSASTIDTTDGGLPVAMRCHWCTSASACAGRRTKG